MKPNLLRAAVLFVAATGTAIGADETPAPVVKNEIGVSVEWAVQLAPGDGDRFAKLRPVVDGDRVYSAARHGYVGSYRRNNGEALWTVKIDADVTGGPTIADGRMYLGTRDADVIALDKDHGTVLWRTTVSSEVLAPPKVANGMVVVQTNDGKIFGLRAETGERVWVYDRTVPVLTVRGTSAPLVTENAVVAGFANGRLVELSLRDGSVLWDTTIAVPKGRSELARMVDIDSEPKLADGVLYTVSFQGRVAAVDLASGRILWARDMSSHLGLSVAAEHLFVADTEGNIWCLDRDSGATVWMQDKLRGRELSSPTTADGRVVVGSGDGTVYWISQEDGHLVAALPASRVEDKVGTARWENGWFQDEEDDFMEGLHTTAPSVSAPPVVVKDTVYVRYRTNILAAVKIKK